MHEQDNEDDKDGFFTAVIKDEGVHRAAAGVVVAAVVAGAKYFIFNRS